MLLMQLEMGSLGELEDSVDALLLWPDISKGVYPQLDVSGW